MLLEFYAPLKQAHVLLVGASVGLFLARAGGVLAARRWAMAPWVRAASVAIDTLLLSAGVALWLALSLNPLRDAWLGSKLLMLLLYIGLGSLALKRARGRAARALCLLAAVVVLATMVSVALTKQPLGWLAP